MAAGRFKYISMFIHRQIFADLVRLVFRAETSVEFHNYVVVLKRNSDTVMSLGGKFMKEGA